MLNTFPEILFLAPFSATLLRIVVGLFFVWCGKQYWKTNSIKHNDVDKKIFQFLSVLSILVGVFLFIGLYTQINAVLGFIISILGIYSSKFKVLPRTTLIFMLVICISLILSGAGPIAFDIPL